MSFTLHIDPLSVPADDVSGSTSEFSGLSLLARIWMWLTQIWGRETFTDAAQSVFCLGMDVALKGHRFQDLLPAGSLNRQRRRLIARYTRLGLSLYQIKAWVKARRKSHRFQTALAGYYCLAFFRSKARRLSRTATQSLGQDELCKAPLSPD